LLLDEYLGEHWPGVVHVKLPQVGRCLSNF